MQYRPEGLENPYIVGIDGSGQEDILHEGWEAGADAILEGLVKEGNSRGGHLENDEIFGTGTWVFIPEE